MTQEYHSQSSNLDFLRAYAVLAVYFGHLLQVHGVERILGPFTIFDLAQTGVLIFFVHTSLVLMLSLERQTEGGAGLFGVFYVRRIFRIFPLSIATIVVMLLIHAPSFPTRVYCWPGWALVFSNLTLTQNLTMTGSYPAVLWSLPFEVQMYLVLPALFLLISRHRSPWLPFGLWVGAVGVLIIMQRLGLKELCGLLQFTPCFLGGVLGYRLWSHAPRQLGFWLWPVTITAGVALRVAAEATGFRGASTIAAWLVCLGLGFCVPRFRPSATSALKWISAQIAKYSYGIYLGHLMVFWIAFVLLRSAPLAVQAIVCVVLSVAFPFAMFHLIEHPMIRVGVRLSQRLGRRAGALSAAIAG